MFCLLSKTGFNSRYPNMIIALDFHTLCVPWSITKRLLQMHVLDWPKEKAQNFYLGRYIYLWHAWMMQHHHNLISHTEQKLKTYNLTKWMLSHLITIQMLRIPHPNTYQSKYVCTSLTSFKGEVAETRCLIVVIKIEKWWSQVSSSSLHPLKVPFTKKFI